MIQPARVGLIGDLHFSDRATGKYIDYFAMCRDIGEEISRMIIAEKLTHLFLAGDIVGTNSKTMKTNGARLYLFQLFAQWNTLLNGNVYSLRGNHDSSATTCDFELLKGAMLLKHGEPEVDCGAFRIHMLDYGDDNRPLNLDTSGERINVAFMHAHLTIENKTNFIPFKGGTELSDMQNLKGCEAVICGHIHNPSMGYLPTSIGDTTTNLLYLGCPTRPSSSDKWDKTHVLVLETTVNDQGVAVASQHLVTFNLPQKSALTKEVLANSRLNEMESQEDITNIEDLERILSYVGNFQIGGIGSYKEQLTRLAGLNKAAADLAIQYIEKAEELCKTKGSKKE